MKITNHHGLSDAIVRACTAHEHRGADYSASMLTKSPRQVWLQRRHDHEIEEDASSMIWALLGTATHYMVQKAAGKNALAEEYLETTIGNVKLSGIPDLYENDVIDDYKVTSAWTLVYGDRIEEWEKQLNTYAFLFRRYGFTPKQLFITAFLRDWSASKAREGGNYPQAQVVRIPIKMWSADEAEHYVTSRVQAFDFYKTTPDADLPHCTPKERWESATVYAVVKEGRKSAVKLWNDEVSAHQHSEELGKGHSVTTRPGEWKRCSEYCSAAPFCNQYQEYKKQGEVK